MDKIYSGDPWHADEDEYSVRIFRGAHQIIKAPKDHPELDLDMEPYWPDSETLEWMLRVLNSAEASKSST